MEMEHINENTIRVMIGHDDLEERGGLIFRFIR